MLRQSDESIGLQCDRCVRQNQYARQPWRVGGKKCIRRTLLGAPGIATRNKGLTTRNKKLVETIYASDNRTWVTRPKPARGLSGSTEKKERHHRITYTKQTTCWSCFLLPLWVHMASSFGMHFNKEAPHIVGCSPTTLLIKDHQRFQGSPISISELMGAALSALVTWWARLRRCKEDLVEMSCHKPCRTSTTTIHAQSSLPDLNPGGELHFHDNSMIIPGRRLTSGIRTHGAEALATATGGAVG